MSTIYNWKSGTSGDWGTAADWSGNAFPDSAIANVTIAGVGSTVTVAGGESFTADSVTIETGSTLNVQGLLNLSGGSDQIVVSSGLLEITTGGTIANGTIVSSSGTVELGDGVTLQHITYRGSLNITESYRGISIVDGLNVLSADGKGPGAINITSYYDTLYFGNETIDNVGINLGAAGQRSNDQLVAGNYQQLVFGTHVVINSNGLYTNFMFGYQADIINEGQFNIKGAGLNIEPAAFTNAGTIDVFSGSLLDIFAASFVNNGVVNVAGGSMMILSSGQVSGTGEIKVGGTLELGVGTPFAALSQVSVASGGVLELNGSFNVGGGTIDIKTGGEFANLVINNGTLTNGFIAASDGGKLTLNNATFNAMAYSGTLNVTGQYNNLNVENGLTATGGVINLTDAAYGGEALNFLDSETLNNQTVLVGGSSVNGFPGGTVNDQYGTLTLGVTTEILQASMTTQGGTIAGNIVNDGLISVAAGPFSITGAYDYVTNQYDDNFVNAATGTITIGAGAVLSVTTPTFNNAGLLQTTGGTISIAPTQFTNMPNGTLTGGIYDIEAGGTLLLPHIITTDAANIILSGTGSAIESGTTTIEKSLTSISATGTLQILGNRGYTSSKSITDSGSLALGGGTFSPALTINSTGQVSGYGKFSAPITDNGLITATQSTLTLAGALTGTGGVLIDAGATLVLGAGDASTNQITFGGTKADLVLNAPGSVAGPFVSLAASDTIDLSGVLASSASISGGSLVVSLTAGGTLGYKLNNPGGQERVATSSDGHGGTNLAVYNEATAATVAPVNFGIVHVGQAASDFIVISNNAAPGAYSEGLDAGFSGTSTGFTSTGSLTGLAAGGTSSNGLSVGLNTSKAGIFSGTTTLGLASDGSGIDTLGTTALGSDIINLTGTVNNYATVGVSLISGPGKLAVNGPTTFSLNLGSVAQGSIDPSENIGIVNAARGPADLLSGSLSLSGTTGAFIDNSAISFSGIAAGSVSTGHTISLKTNNIGTFSETIVLHPTGSNASGYAGTLAAETFIVTGTVTAAAAVTSPGPMNFIAPASSAAAASNAPLTGIAAWARWPALGSATSAPPTPPPAAPISMATASPAGMLTPYSSWLAETAATTGVVTHPASPAW